MEPSLTTFFIEHYDDSFKTVKSGNYGDIIPFSTEIIIEDMIKSGLKFYDSLKILEIIRPLLEEGMHVDKITKLINQAILKLGYSEANLLLDSQTESIQIRMQDGTKIPLTYKFLKTYASDILSTFEYSSRIFQNIIEEFHRILRTLGTSSIKIETLNRLKHLVLKNVIDIDPWSRQRTIALYQETQQYYEGYMHTWAFIPLHEKKTFLLKLFEDSLKIILMSFDYLPGSSLGITINQMDKLITSFSNSIKSKKQRIDWQLLSATIKNLNQLNRMQNSNDDLVETLIDAIESHISEIMDIVHGLMNRSSVSWMLVISEGGTEYYARFSKIAVPTHRRVLAPALAGIQSIIAEITEQSLTQLEYEDGIILVEKRELFKIVVLANEASHLLRQKIDLLAEFIDVNLATDILHFKGRVDIFYKKIDQFIATENLEYLFESDDS